MVCHVSGRRCVSMHIHMLFSFFPSDSAIDNSSFDCEGMEKSQTERGEGQGRIQCISQWQL